VGEEEEERVFPSNKHRAFELNLVASFFILTASKKEGKKKKSEIGPEFTIDQMKFMILGLMKCAIN